MMIQIETNGLNFIFLRAVEILFLFCIIIQKEQTGFKFSDLLTTLLLSELSSLKLSVSIGNKY